MGINRDDWLKALADAGVSHEDDQGAITAAEFSETFGICRSSATTRLKLLVEMKKATQTMKWVHASDGRRHHCVAYRLIEAPKGHTPKGKR